MPQGKAHLLELAQGRLCWSMCRYHLSHGVSQISLGIDDGAKLIPLPRTASPEVSSMPSFRPRSVRSSVSSSFTSHARTQSSRTFSSELTSPQTAIIALWVAYEFHFRHRISVAALISFAARGLSTTEYFCYESVASAGVVMVLPGYVVRKSRSHLVAPLECWLNYFALAVCGSLELASKNLIAGSVRMVYA